MNLRNGVVCRIKATVGTDFEFFGMNRFTVRALGLAANLHTFGNISIFINLIFKKNLFAVKGKEPNRSFIIFGTTARSAQQLRSFRAKLRVYSSPVRRFHHGTLAVEVVFGADSLAAG